MSSKLVVLKLGGALLTDKQRPYTLRPSILRQAAAELRACLDAGLIEQLLLVHGVGSFGHPPVVTYRLHKGLQSPDQLIHLTETQNTVMRLRQAIAEEFHKAGIAVATIMPSSCMAASTMTLKSSYLDAVSGFLDIGMTPLLGGDVVVDDQMGFCVFDGDRIAVDLALHFNASHLIFATDVDGIYDKDPRSFPQAERIDRFSLSKSYGDAAQLDDHHQADASGAMAGKLTAVQPTRSAIASGLQVHILSMIEEGNLQNLLDKKAAVGTRIVP